jgi:uncharacterized protein
VKLQPDPKPSLNTVTRYDAQYIEINEHKYESSIFLMPEGEVQAWPVRRFADIGASNLQHILEIKPALVIFGSGQRLRFLKPAVIQDLMKARIGFETMDTQAACRTYNILMGEGRHVMGLFLLENE